MTTEQTKNRPQPLQAAALRQIKGVKFRLSMAKKLG